MVPVQLFIIRIALSNLAAPSYPFSLLLYHTAAAPLSWGVHTYSGDVDGRFFIIIIQWMVYMPQHSKPQFLLERILLEKKKKKP